MNEAVGYSILQIKEGMFDVQGVPFGVKGADGMITSYSVKAVDDIYRQMMEVDEDENISYFNYPLGKDYQLNVGVPTKYIKDAKWKTIFESPMVLVALQHQNNPMLLDMKMIMIIHNIINKTQK